MNPAGTLVPSHTTSINCWRLKALLKAQRISFLSHGGTVWFTVNILGQGSRQA
jgi:hypothetical protein